MYPSIRSLCLYFIVSLFIGCSGTHKEEEEQEAEPNTQHVRAQKAFDALKAVSDKDKGSLWGVSIYGPTILVDRATRSIIANEGDALHVLQPDGPIYVGSLPDSINIANTAFQWLGKRWNMIALPLPAEEDDAVTLLAHESFHRLQPELGFSGLLETENKHLDERDARVLFRLELEALRTSLQHPDQPEHIAHALFFRHLRHDTYSGASSAENSLELNEGLAEYTGVMIGNPGDPARRNRMENKITELLDAPSYVRSFAYATLPVYGYHLAKKDPKWNQHVNLETDLTALISEHLAQPFSKPDSTAFVAVAQRYAFDQITKEENAREEKRQAVKANYRNLFTQDAAVTVPLVEMNISFNPSNLVPLDTLGTVYPTMRITDQWGILEVDSVGGLLSQNWSSVTLTPVRDQHENIILGDGWSLTLNASWTLVQNGPGYVLQRSNL